MYVKKILIAKELEWIRSITPGKPRLIFTQALAELGCMYKLGILSEREYERLYEDTVAKRDKKRKEQMT